MLAITIGQAGGTARRRPPYFKTKKVGILGSTASLQYAPFHDPSWTLVAHPCCRPACKREPDWYIDLHRPECFRTERKSWNQKYYTWLKSLQTPIFMQDDWPDVPMAVRYPLERITAEHRSSVTGRLYATNHCAYVIALALTEGVTTIGLFGCQYSAATEHGVQRDSLTYWIGRFEQAGGRVVVPPKFNTLLSEPFGLYGYDSHDEKGQLVEEYRAKPAVVKPAPDGRLEKHTLTLVPDGPIAHVPLSEPVAWDRAKEYGILQPA